MKRTLLHILIVCVAFVSMFLLVSCAGPELRAFASPVGPIEQPAPPAGEIPSLQEAFAILAAGVVGGIIAFLFERFKWFQNLVGEARFWIVFALSVGLPLLARVALQYVPPEVWMFLEPYWQSIALGFLAFIASQVAHRFDKNGEKT